LEEIQPFVEQHREAYALAEVGLARKSVVPIQYTQDYISNHVGEVGTLKTLANAIAVRGRGHELKGEHAAAAKEYLAGLRLGAAISTGGLMIDAMVGTACETIAVMNLSGLYHHLDAPTCREVIRELLEADTDWEPSATFAAREDRLARGTWTGAVVSMMHGDAMKKAQDKFSQRTLERDRQRRHLLIAVAARAFELETGAKAKSVAELVPKYLPAAPLDPGGGNLDHPIP
jgi:hypothetical protein